MTSSKAIHRKHLHPKFQLPLVIGLAVIYGILAYLTSRNDFYTLITLVALSYLLTFLVLEKTNISFEKLFALSIIFRLVFLFSIPFLSQDFFRFLWDGELVVNGLNPYAHTVDSYFETNQYQVVENAALLREGMGELNAGNYSNYPPLSQFIYAISAFVAQGSVLGFVICLRLILISFDVVFVVFAGKLLKRIGLQQKYLFWYILNPLCILEITGNLHLEGVMISLFVASVYLIVKHKMLLSSVLLSLSVSAKLLSLLFFPFLLKYIYSNFKSKTPVNIVSYSGVFAMALALQFLVFFNPETGVNFLSSVGLWFTNFEFNASIYYLTRWVGYELVGWNIIKYYGMIFPIVFLVFYSILLVRFKTAIRSLFGLFLVLLTVYFLLSTTVHPWYILFPLALGVFTTYRFPVVWSAVVFLSYYAYREGNFQENMMVIGLEYAVVLLTIGYEVYTKKLSFLRKHPIA